MATKTRRPRDDEGIVRLVEALTSAELSCTIRLPWKQEIRVAEEHGPPVCTLVLKSERLLRRPLTELSLGRAYVEGDLDIEHLNVERDATKVFRLRDELRSGTSPLEAVRLAGQIALVRPTRANSAAIADHYSLPHEFFFTFLDERCPLYSQCRWSPRKLSLYEASLTKLRHAWDRLAPQPGARVLDIGAGWGALMGYRNLIRANVAITALTLTEDSKDYIKENVLVHPWDEVIVEDLLDHRRYAHYDHVAILGVIEHIPTYARFSERVWDALKPGGLLYLDASATREKYAGSAFTRRYTWPGPHACLALPDLTEELLFHGFAIREIDDGSEDYRITMREWARNLESNREKIRRCWGDYYYRTWRVFLWGGTAAFETGRLQSYTLVAQRLESKGPRPGRLRRAAHFAASLR
jgi:cyclopropane-fatty-acyl-phospholipid synthase